MATLRRWTAVLTGALTLAPSALVAQVTVSGQLSLLEQPGETSYDLATAVIYLVPAAGTHVKLKTENVTVTMHDRDFGPHVSVTTVGSTVRFENQDPFAHNAFSNSKSGTFDFGLSDRGTTVQRRLKHTGVYPVFCNVHARMSAWVVVVATPYYALAGTDGRFTIARVPPGRYTLHAWHPRGGEMTRSITVTDESLSDVAIELDARGFRATKHKNKLGQAYPDAGYKY